MSVFQDACNLKFKRLLSLLFRLVVALFMKVKWGAHQKNIALMNWTKFALVVF
jgi:hypothetical protein